MRRTSTGRNLGVGLGSLLLLAGLGLGQETAGKPEAGEQTSAAEGPVHTLHVYTNLIQLPTLVLDQFGEPVKERSGQKFLVSLDGGPPFKPTHVKPEAEDPISLAVLLDASGSQDDLMNVMQDALGGMTTEGLRPHDHVSVYAIDCIVKRSMNDAPADGRQVRKAVADLLGPDGVHPGKPRHSCGNSVKLWDAVDFLVGQLKDVPGRRVVLVVSDGEDRGSMWHWDQVTDDAQKHGVAVFGLKAPVGRLTTSYRGQKTSAPLESTNAFDPLCQGSGGKVLLSDGASLPTELKHFVKMLRTRYIVEFPRPDGVGSGSHSINITISGANYFIRPAGISVPVARPEERSKPVEEGSGGGGPQ